MSVTQLVVPQPLPIQPPNAIMCNNDLTFVPRRVRHGSPGVIAPIFSCTKRRAGKATAKLIRLVTSLGFVVGLSMQVWGAGTVPVLGVGS